MPCGNIDPSILTLERRHIMARKIEKKKMRITTKDKSFMQVLSKTGRCFAEDADTYFNIKKSRINKMVHNGYLEKEPIMFRQKATFCYRLTRKAQRWISKNIATVNRFYKPAKRGTLHDLVLFKELAQKPKHVQDIAMTEADLVHHYGSLSYFSPPDLFIPSTTRIDELGFTISTSPEVIEVVSKNYSTAEIQAKVDYSKHFLNISEGGITFIETN